MRRHHAHIHHTPNTHVNTHVVTHTLQHATEASSTLGLSAEGVFETPASSGGKDTAKHKTNEALGLCAEQEHHPTTLACIMQQIRPTCCCNKRGCQTHQAAVHADTHMRAHTHQCLMLNTHTPHQSPEAGNKHASKEDAVSTSSSNKKVDEQGLSKQDSVVVTSRHATSDRWAMAVSQQGYKTHAVFNKTLIHRP